MLSVNLHHCLKCHMLIMRWHPGLMQGMTCILSSMYVQTVFEVFSLLEIPFCSSRSTASCHLPPLRARQLSPLPRLRHSWREHVWLPQAWLACRPRRWLQLLLSASLWNQTAPVCHCVSCPNMAVMFQLLIDADSGPLTECGLNHVIPRADVMDCETTNC